MEIDKRSNPSVKRILDWWLTTPEATAKVLEIDSSLSTFVVKKLMTIDYDWPMCWACQKSRSQWQSFERCHILARSFGGKSEPSNYVIMCRACHNESPDSTCEVVFWRWFDQKKTINQIYAENIKLLKDSYGVNLLDIYKAFDIMIHEVELESFRTKVSPSAIMSALESQLQKALSDVRSQDQVTLSITSNIEEHTNDGE